MKTSDFSVVTTTFNDAEGIIGFLSNIIKQTVTPREIIITDGGSKDRTLDLIKEFSDSTTVPIRLYSPGRLNISQGFNYSIKHCKTEYVCICAVGNRYPDNFFERLLASFSDDTDLQLACANIDGDTNSNFSKMYSEVLLPHRVISVSGNHGMMVKTSLFADIGFFYEKFYFAGEDEEFLQRVLNCGKRIKVLSDCFVHWMVPNSWKEYKTQIKRYVIAVMQIYTNSVVFKFYAKQVFYIVGIFVALLCLFVKPVRLLGGILLFLYAVLNLRTIFNKGVQAMLLKNFEFFVTTKTLITKFRFLIKSNKIEPEFLLNKRSVILPNSEVV